MTPRTHALPVNQYLGLGGFDGKTDLAQLGFQRDRPTGGFSASEGERQAGAEVARLGETDGVAVAGAQGHNQRRQTGERAVHRHTCTRRRALERQGGVSRSQGHRAEILIHTRHDVQRQRQGHKARCAER